MRGQAASCGGRVAKFYVLICLLLSASLVMWAGVAGGEEAGPTGPGVVVMDNAEGDMGAVTFDHEAHTFMAEACVQCHHNHGADNTRCMECHDLKPEQFKHSVKSSFMACYNCHGGIDPDYPGVPPLKVALHTKCFGCHRDMGNIGKTPKGCTELCHTSKGQQP